MVVASVVEKEVVNGPLEDHDYPVRERFDGPDVRGKLRPAGYIEQVGGTIRPVYEAYGYKYAHDPKDNGTGGTWIHRTVFSTVILGEFLSKDLAEAEVKYFAWTQAGCPDVA